MVYFLLLNYIIKPTQWPLLQSDVVKHFPTIKPKNDYKVEQQTKELLSTDRSRQTQNMASEITLKLVSLSFITYLNLPEDCSNQPTHKRHYVILYIHLYQPGSERGGSGVTLPRGLVLWEGPGKTKFQKFIVI